MNGIFNILKPSGMSSNAVLSKIKKRFNIKKVGHLGREARIEDSRIQTSFELFQKNVFAACSIQYALCQKDILFKYNSIIFSFDTQADNLYERYISFIFLSIFLSLVRTVFFINCCVIVDVHPISLVFHITL